MDRQTRIEQLHRDLEANATRQMIWWWERHMNQSGEKPRYSDPEVDLMINALIDEAVDLQHELERMEKEYE